MKKIVEYAVCIYSFAPGYDSLEELVNRKIKEGFQPYGFPCIAAATAEDADGHKQSDTCVIQAMVKYEDDNQHIPTPVYKSK